MDLTSFSLRSERLLLTATQAEFAGDIFREFTDEITTFMGPTTPRSVDEVTSFIINARALMAAGREIHCSLFTEASREFIGCAGLHKIGTAAPELGIWIKKGAHGRHYGREAVTALAAWAIENLACSHLIYPVDRRNFASRSIPESLGASVESEYEWVRSDGKVLDLVEYHIHPEALRLRVTRAAEGGSETSTFRSASSP